MKIHLDTVTYNQYCEKKNLFWEETRVALGVATFALGIFAAAHNPSYYLIALPCLVVGGIATKIVEVERMALEECWKKEKPLIEFSDKKIALHVQFSGEVCYKKRLDFIKEVEKTNLIAIHRFVTSSDDVEYIVNKLKEQNNEVSELYIEERGELTRSGAYDSLA